MQYKANSSLYTSYGASKQDVSDEFLYQAYSNDPKCCRCGNTPSVRVMPKHDHLNTAEMQSGVYVCDHCIQLNIFNPSEYGVRKL